MAQFNAHAIATGSNDEVFALLGEELTRRVSVERSAPEFLEQLRQLPIGLRAMASTYELDVSLALDDLGWHFGNWHDRELADETVAGLVELGATELAELVKTAFELARSYWKDLGSDNWMEWYHGSKLEADVEPLNQRAWKIRDSQWNGIFGYWVEYARRYPERCGVGHDA